MRVLLTVMALLTLTTPQGTSAQWLKLPTPGIPRTPDGRPDLTATPPRSADGRPDLSGTWVMSPGPHMLNVSKASGADNMQPWARQLMKERLEALGKDDPSTHCLPQGPRRNRSPFGLVKIVQSPLLILVLYEDLSYRQIFLDGRTLPDHPSPSFMGYSVGRWEGDTLIVETTGFKDRTWLDYGGSPHSEALRIVERFRRTAFGRIAIEETFDDPQAYRRPWTVQTEASLVADTELLEYVCTENERSRQHLVGTSAEERSREVRVAPEVLAGYAGVYEARLPTGVAIRFTLSMSGGQLMVDGLPLIPLSETLFGGPFQLRVAPDERGHGARLFVLAVEGELLAERIPEVR